MDIKQVALKAVKEANEAIKSLYFEDIKFEMKNDRDILAEADVKSETIILKNIKEVFPDHSILSEEKGLEETNSEFLWIVDPLDGTINFSRNIDEFCISIAVAQKDTLILGIIYEPLKNNLYIAEKGKGAFLNDKKITVSDESDVANILLATDNSSNLETRQKNFDILSKICTDVRHLRIFGSGALHLAKVASGKIDAYFKTKANYWDYAAGILLVQEAGGVVSDMQGNEFSKSSKNIIVTNNAINDRVIELINR